MRFPDDTQRHMILGTTGSGKTYRAMHQLSQRRFDLMPWVIYNFKSDENIDSIPYARHIELDEIPIQPGVYIVHPRPDEGPEMEKQMWAIWDRGDTGVYIDEGLMVGRYNKAFRAILTQGRSKHVPVILLSQRPAWLDVFSYSESEFLEVFRLQGAKDRKKIGEYMPKTVDIEKTLPDFHSYYYDVSLNRAQVSPPCPSLPTIMAAFDRRLRDRKRTI